MSTSIKWNTCGSREMKVVARPRWRAIRHGLGLAVLGNLLLLGPGLLGLAFLVGPPEEALLASNGLAREDTWIVGLALACVGGLGYLLALLGQWRCLVHAPQGSSAKEIQFASLLCYLFVPGCFVTAHFVGGKETYAALHNGPEALLGLDFTLGGFLLQVTGLLLVLLNVLLFSGFARAVVRAARDERGVRAVGRYFWFLAFLLGGTVGLIVEARRSGQAEPLLALALGWLFGLLWHTLLLRGTRRRLAHILRSQGSRLIATRPPAQANGQIVLSAAAYLGQAR